MSKKFQYDVVAGKMSGRGKTNPHTRKLLVKKKQIKLVALK